VLRQNLEGSWLRLQTEPIGRDDGDFLELVAFLIAPGASTLHGEPICTPRDAWQALPAVAPAQQSAEWLLLNGYGNLAQRSRTRQDFALR